MSLAPRILAKCGSYTSHRLLQTKFSAHQDHRSDTPSCQLTGFDPSTNDHVQSLWSDCQCTRQRIDELESQLEEVVSQRSRTPSHLKEDIQDKDYEIKKLRNAVFSLQLKLKDQEEQLRLKDIRIVQQAETIQIHSDEISKAHHRSAKFETTPIRYPSKSGLASEFHGLGQPPAYSQPNQFKPAPKQHFRTKWGDIPQGNDGHNLHGAVNRCTDLFGDHNIGAIQSAQPLYPPAASESHFPALTNRMGKLDVANRADETARNIFTTPPRATQQRSTDVADHRLTPVTSHSSGQVPIPPVPPQTPSRSDSVVSRPRSAREGVMALYGSSTSKEAMVAKMFADLFDHVADWAYRYANTPSTQADSSLPQNLKQRLMNAATKTTAHKIMSSQSTRYLLVAKVIISWIQSNVFKESAFSGLDKNIDETTNETRKKIFNDTPAPVRFVFLQDIANQFGKLRKAANYHDYLSALSHRRAEELWGVIRPLMYVKTEGDWQSMHNLVREAHRVAEMQLADIAEFRLFFPKVHDPFNDASMANMDGEFDNFSADELMVRRANVRLGVTPQVMARVTSPDGTIVTKTLMKAGVLLKLGDRGK